MEVGEVLIAVGGTLPAGEIHGLISSSKRIVHPVRSSNWRHGVAESNDLLCCSVSTEEGLHLDSSPEHGYYVSTPAAESTGL